MARDPASLLDDEAAMLRRRWPAPRTWTFADATARVCGPETQATLLATARRLRTLDALAERPIVAVAGMLNAGKTSVVSRFLSEAGRQRAPQGLRSVEGTQRFVLWLPSSWRADGEVWDAVQSHVREVFGSPTELLADEPRKAHAQYSGADAGIERFGIPLVATDDALDEVGFAFLDCPDVQRRHGAADPDAVRGVRLSVLGRAAQLCSAFFVVSTLDGVQDRTLHAILAEIAGRAPGVRRYLLLNKLRPDVPPHEAYAELADVGREHEIAGLFGAWDYAIEGSDAWTPDGEAADGPAFYALDPDPQRNPPHGDVEGRRLVDLAALLPAGELHAEKARSLRASLKTQVQHALQQIVAAAEESQQRVGDAQRGVLVACGRTLRDAEGQLRVPIDAAFLEAFLQSLERTAPAYVRVFSWMNRPLRALSRGIREGLREVQDAFRPVDAVRERMMSDKVGLVVDVDAIVNALKGEDVDHLVHERADLTAAARKALDRFRAEHRSNPDPSALDRSTRELWASMPLWRKATSAVTTVTSLALSLAAVALIPVDWGTSVFFAASIKEMLAAAVVGGAAGMAAEVPLRTALERQAGWPAFSDLRALLCDALGLPRDRLDGEPWALEDVRLPDPEVGPGVVPDHVLDVLEIDAGWAHQLEAS